MGGESQPKSVEEVDAHIRGLVSSLNERGEHLMGGKQQWSLWWVPRMDEYKARVGASLGGRDPFEFVAYHSLWGSSVDSGDRGWVSEDDFPGELSVESFIAGTRAALEAMPGKPA